MKMLCRTMKKKLSKGIGLLELMLSLAIIAILLIMATRYYQAASSSNSTSETVDMVNAVSGAVKNFLSSNINSATYPSVTELVNSGYLPGSYKTGTGVNPFGGDICVATPADPASCGTSAVDMAAQYAVVVTGIPIDSCAAVQSKLQATASSKSVTACGSAGDQTLQVTYSN